MKLKVGDKVRVKSLEWYNKNKQDIGLITFMKGPCFTKGMSKFCGKEATIKRIDGDSYVLDIGTYYFSEDSVELISNEIGLKVNNISVSTNTCITLKEGVTAKICTENGKTKIMIENNEVKEEEPKFKKGDIVFLETQGANKMYQNIFVVESHNKYNIHLAISLCLNDNELTYRKGIDVWFVNGDIEYVRFATEEEKRTLFLAMLNQGLFWDEKKMKVRTLKDGDIITIQDIFNCSWYSIFKEIKDRRVYGYSHFNNNENLYYKTGPLGGIDCILSIHYSTTEERQALFDKIEEREHKKWNAETKKFENIKWRAKNGEKYWYVYEDGTETETTDTYSAYDNGLFSFGNYFQTKELAEAAANKIKELLSKL